MRIVLIIVVVLIVYECIVGVSRKLNRRRVYKMAKARSESTGLPLLVIGDPYNGVMSISTGADYGCGDLCLDLTGCSKCRYGIKGYLENVLPTIDLRKYVVYISCTLEYVSDLPIILSYLKTVPYKNMFIVNVEWYCLTSYLYPFFLTGEQPPKYVVYSCPPWTSVFKYKELWKYDMHSVAWNA